MPDVFALVAVFHFALICIASNEKTVQSHCDAALLSQMSPVFVP